MSYKSIAVCLDDGEGSSRRLQFAIDLAVRHEAFLIGFHLARSPLLMPDPYTVWAPMMMELEDSEVRKLEFAKESFLLAARAAGIKAESVGYRSHELNELIAHARSSDMTIIGQYHHKESESGFGRHFAKSFILKLGRPVVIVPFAESVPRRFTKIVVAWDGGREASRAIADAMPFLMRAKTVHVISVAEISENGKELPDVDIAGYLAKHNINVEVEISEMSDIPASDCLLKRAAQLDADLIVMGAYGHHRHTEIVLGGMTHTMLNSMNLPVLMSY
jgi:nucleotide-binding universal stress UspA family protein